MSAWRKHMKTMLIGGGALAGIVLLVLAVTMEGWESRPFAKKVARRPAAAAREATKKDVSRQELEELLSL